MCFKIKNVCLFQHTYQKKSLFPPYDYLFLKIKTETDKTFCFFPKSLCNSSAQVRDFCPPVSLSFPADEKKKKTWGFL